jgi:hypothetical protein
MMHKTIGTSCVWRRRAYLHHGVWQYQLINKSLAPFLFYLKQLKQMYAKKV